MSAIDDVFTSISKSVSPTKPSSVFTEEVMKELEQSDLEIYRKLQNVINSIVEAENTNLTLERVNTLLQIRALAETYR